MAYRHAKRAAVQAGSSEITNAHMVVGLLRHRPLRDSFAEVGLFSESIDHRLGINNSKVNLRKRKLLPSPEFRDLTSEAGRIALRRGNFGIGSLDLLASLVQEDRTIRLFIIMASQNQDDPAEIQDTFEALEQFSLPPERTEQVSA